MTPELKPVDIGDKKIFDRYFTADPPEVSELTFTNLFMWAHRYHPRWTELKDTLLIVIAPDNSPPFGLPPVGTGDKREAIEALFDILSEKSSEPRICRVPESYIQKYVDTGRYTCMEDRDNSDYVYKSKDLINLTGRKYHRKKNHLNRFLKNYRYEYSRLDLDLVECFIGLQEEWCQMRECIESAGLLSEDYAIHRALTHYEDLGFVGGAIKVDGRMEAFSLGEKLNPDTAVIHIEKANPEIPELYTVINQQFCLNAWSEIRYINREQDLGLEGLRKAKESYYPHHMIKKYRVTKKEP